MTNLLPLITRLEAASGPDRELDAEIAFATRHPVNPAYVREYAISGAKMNPTLSPIQNYLLENSPHYTSSLDAAIALAERVLPGWHWSVYDTDGTIANNASAQVEPPEFTFNVSDGVGKTPALALCIAILRAVSEQKPSSSATSP